MSTLMFASASGELYTRLHGEIRRAQRYGRKLSLLTLAVSAVERATSVGVALTPEMIRAVVQTIEAFKAFTPAFIISGGTGGPINSTLFYTLYLYQEAFGNFRMGYASALAWILVVIIAIFTAFSFLTSRYWVHYDD